jgi:DNA-binding FrmR family transcriptional regulator
MSVEVDMTDEITIESIEASKCEYNEKTLHRIHRIQGQLASLEQIISRDEETCKNRVVRARTIEKAMSSLIAHLVECYLVNTADHEIVEEPEATVSEIMEIMDLLNGEEIRSIIPVVKQWLQEDRKIAKE